MTNVNAENMRIDGSIVTDVLVLPEGTLSGNCSILQNQAATNYGNLTNLGTVSPGDDQLGLNQLRAISLPQIPEFSRLGLLQQLAAN